MLFLQFLNTFLFSLSLNRRVWMISKKLNILLICENLRQMFHYCIMRLPRKNVLFLWHFCSMHRLSLYKLFLQCLSAVLSAPEIFQSFVSGGTGYAFEVDWWSLGVTIFEVLRGWVRHWNCSFYVIGLQKRTRLHSVARLSLPQLAAFPPFVTLSPC